MKHYKRIKAGDEYIYYVFIGGKTCYRFSVSHDHFNKKKFRTYLLYRDGLSFVGTFTQGNSNPIIFKGTMKECRNNAFKEIDKLEKERNDRG